VSAGQFKVGDVCVGQNFARNTDRNGVECEILALDGVRESRGVSGVVGTWWRVQWADGRVSNARTVNLRRKEPPKPAREIDTVVSWSDCAWSPERVPA
jgi:hypothetical protein